MKKYKDFLTEAQAGVVNNSVDLNNVNYGNAPLEFVELAQKPNDAIKNWFVDNGIVEKIKQEAPSNNSKTTKDDLEKLLILMQDVPGEEITFARYIDNESNLAQAFIDLLKENGYEETMGGFFSVDS